MESNKQRSKNDLSMNPIADKAALKMVNFKKPSSAFAMKMSETKSGLPMKQKGDLNKDNKMSGYEKTRQTAIDNNSPAPMYGSKEAAPKMIKDKSIIFKTSSPLEKSEQKVEQDYARNAIADYKKGDKKAANYEKKKALETAAGENR